MSQDNLQNKLASESSPYLLQHADNPVKWYPWGDEAFEQARKEDKPVFLSIGYATCHWCHVMAHESFEDEQVAAMMNKSFVNIKVDREERPDIDNTYMLICQMLTGSGGWPMNVFLTPDKEPFYAATYIPKQGRHGRPGMLELIPRISQLWNKDRQKVLNSTDEIINAFKKSNTFEPGDRLSEKVINKAYNQYERQYDEVYGGFSSAPKFPSPHNLLLLLRYVKRNPGSQALPMVDKTLTNMRRGGLFDHVGYGFHRYSTDRKWLVPHFEKMLYDQAMLLMAYTEAWQMTQKERFKETADEIITYLLRKLQDDRNGFYSAEDADSEGEEGKFYVWSTSEIRDLLPASEAELFIEVFNLSEKGNYQDEASGKRTGKNIPHLQKSLKELARERDMDPQELAKHLESIRKKVLDKRGERVHPLLDDKILTDWNGLVIAALAKAGRAFQNDQYIEQAKKCFDFISANLIENDTHLKHRWRKGDAAINAHADDYAFLIWGLIELYEATYDTKYLQKALSLNGRFITDFWDDQNGGFYFTSESGEELLGRKKEIYDGALPSGNSIAMLNLLRLARMTGRVEWEEMADSMNTLFASDVREAPTGFGAMLQGVDFAVGAPQEIIIAGNKESSDTDKLLQALQAPFLPHSVSLLYDPTDQQVLDLAPYLSDFDMKEDKATAFVCQNYSCELPVTSPEEMLDLINS